MTFQQLGKEFWAVTDGDARSLKVETLASASVTLKGLSADCENKFVLKNSFMNK